MIDGRRLRWARFAARSAGGPGDLVDQGVGAAASAATGAMGQAGAQSTSVGQAVMRGATIGSTIAGVATATGVIGGAVAADVAGTVAATVASAAVSVGADVGTAVAVGAAVGNAIPIPFVGAAIGAVVGAIVGAATAIADATKDTFSPTPEQAQDWIDLFHIDPALMFLNVDRSIAPASAARLERYFNIVAGVVKTGEKGNTGELYNPVSNPSCSNPYMCQSDPDDPLTDASVLDGYYKKLLAAAQKYGGQIWNLPPSEYLQLVPPVITNAAQAASVLFFLRKHATAISDWSEVMGNSLQIQNEIREVRLIAGESGPDANLAKIFGGDVTPLAESYALRVKPTTCTPQAAATALSRLRSPGAFIASGPSQGTAGTLSVNTAVFPKPPKQGSPGTDANHSPGTLQSGATLTYLGDAGIVDGHQYAQVGISPQTSSGGGSMDTGPAPATGYIVVDPGTVSWSGVADADMYDSARAVDARDAVMAIRVLAGESGPDPVLARLFGGDVTAAQPAVSDAAWWWTSGWPGTGPTNTALAVFGVAGACAIAGVILLGMHQRKRAKLPAGAPPTMFAGPYATAHLYGRNLHLRG